jgi:hypothetical protein
LSGGGAAAGKPGALAATPRIRMVLGLAAGLPPMTVEVMRKARTKPKA